MIIEQAFTGLPESLVGNAYPEQEYEAGVVAAFSLALLQQLNGRNVPNPISLMLAERVYASTGFQVNNTPHYWRADLHVNLLPVRAGSRRLERYGFRLSNWLEAKFFRKRNADPGEHETNKTKNTGDLLIDLLRLACLVPLEVDPDRKTFTGRYLLHVYDDEPPYRISPSYRAGEDVRREWLAALTTTGPQTFNGLQLDADAAMRTHVGAGLQPLRAAMGVTTFGLEPIVGRVAGERRLYWCYLTRIDEIDVSWTNLRVQIGKDRQVEETGDDAYAKIRQFVAEQIVGRQPEPPAPGPEELADARQAERRAERAAEVDPYLPPEDPFGED